MAGRMLMRVRRVWDGACGYALFLSSAGLVADLRPCFAGIGRAGRADVLRFSASGPRSNRREVPIGDDLSLSGGARYRVQPHEDRKSCSWTFDVGIYPPAA